MYLCSVGSFGLRRSCTRGSAGDFSVVLFLYSYRCSSSSSRNSSRFSALEPDIAPETAVFRRRPPKTLLEHPPKRATFYMPLRRRKLSTCVWSPSVAFTVGLLPGLHKTAKKSIAEPLYTTLEAQNSLLNKDT